MATRLTCVHAPVPTLRQIPHRPAHAVGEVMPTAASTTGTDPPSKGKVLTESPRTGFPPVAAASDRLVHGWPEMGSRFEYTSVVVAGLASLNAARDTVEGVVYVASATARLALLAGARVGSTFDRPSAELSRCES